MLFFRAIITVALITGCFAWLQQGKLQRSSFSFPKISYLQPTAFTTSSGAGLTAATTCSSSTVLWSTSSQENSDAGGFSSSAEAIRKPKGPKFAGSKKFKKSSSSKRFPASGNSGGRKTFSSTSSATRRPSRYPNDRNAAKAAADKDRVEKWRVFNVDVLLDQDPGKDVIEVHDNLLSSICKTIHVEDFTLAAEDVKIIRKSFDSRRKRSGQPKFVYTVEINIVKSLLKPTFRNIEGKYERLDDDSDDESIDSDNDDDNDGDHVTVKGKQVMGGRDLPTVVVVGAGPAGLFCAYQLCLLGYKPVILERGQPVEVRGRDIGALFNRKILNPDSNLCYGEGGAGTWSDGKLTTRIGKNSGDVRTVLQILVDHGATSRILVDGKPHLGTDKLVKILQDMRRHLIEMGAEFHFGVKVDDVSVGAHKSVDGVVLSDGRKVDADMVVLAVGHSARTLYGRLIDRGVHIEAKPIAVGFRVEHSQDLINSIQYGEFGELCDRGKGRVPVADYKLATEVDVDVVGGGWDSRSCYSFCMCPGGQIVPTSVDPDELCLNGMSFSNRQSKWANSALVVNVTPEDMSELCGDHPLSGVEWQRMMERKAAQMGGGNLVAPVQRMTDFLDGRTYVGTNLPQSSYRMGVKAAPCHEIYPSFVTEALRKALVQFDLKMPGFITEDALMHGVETRTSAPVQITRNAETFECSSLAGLYPTGEGAGYAGGIVSAAVDGLKVAQRIAAVRISNTANYGSQVSERKAQAKAEMR